MFPLQSLQFLLSSPAPQVPSYSQELNALIANTGNTVSDVFDWVEVRQLLSWSVNVMWLSVNVMWLSAPPPQTSSQVPNSKSPEFVNALTTAICSATVSGVTVWIVWLCDYDCVTVCELCGVWAVWLWLCGCDCACVWLQVLALLLSSIKICLGRERLFSRSTLMRTESCKCRYCTASKWLSLN